MSAIYRKLQHDTGTVGFVYVVRKNSMQELQEVFRLCDAMKPAFLQLDDFIASDLKDPWPFETLVTSPSSSFTAELLEPMRHRPYVVIPPRIPDFSHTVNACKSYFDFISLDGNGNIGGCRTSYVPDAAFGNILSSSDVYNTYEMMRLRHNQELGFPAHPECVYCYNNWPEAENNACVGQRPDLPSHSFCFGKTSEGI